ncbi:hypothetical protein SAMN04487788_2315 [Microbacterium testaceum StLB037]|uniref:Uncharacterized protein n=1 Tax=Microbacterium testaceum (strain StLB037) TaxID=979556 RepID=A0A1H0QAC0_MICTS|nr:hypothetical protein [Microbacterium testaceum]SDP14005.1 hypothetical protein SAMN04487788_2315 [Microbacterium testaceum StLB037]
MTVDGSVGVIAAPEAGASVLTGPAQAASDIGGLNITAACKAWLGNDWSAVTVNASDPYGWRCVKPGSSVAVSGKAAMDDVCRINHGAGAYAVLTYSSSYGWRCYR